MPKTTLPFGATSSVVAVSIEKRNTTVSVSSFIFGSSRRCNACTSDEIGAGIKSCYKLMEGSIVASTDQVGRQFKSWFSFRSCVSKAVQIKERELVKSLQS